jgi:outer membrane protein OmpA-like peptidoglycan-associated protein
MKTTLTVILSACVLLLVSCQSPKKMSKHVYMKHSYRAIKKSLKNAAIELVLNNDTIKVVFHGEVLFGFNSSSIEPAMFPALEKFSNSLNKYSKLNILINGHTDSVGTETYNLTLSQKRADTAKAVLCAYNVKSSRILTWGQGFKYPVAPNATEEGRAKNRRVEFVLLYAIEGEK